MDNSEVVKEKEENEAVPVAKGGKGLEENDPELDQLLDSSLSEFGTHVPPATHVPPGATPGAAKPNPIGRSMSRVEDTQNDDPSMNELEKVFGEEFAAQAEAQLNEAIQMLATENPELMKQFEYYMGGALSGTEGDDKATPLSPPTTIPAKKPQKPPFKKTRSSLDAILEETVRNIQKSSQQAEGGGAPPNLTDMMNKLQLESIDGDEDILKAMEKMMGTLLSKDVLYPSIKELCNQYPEWLRSHEDSLSPEDRARYGKQLEIMTAICTEFEGQGEEMEKQERILQLMQKLQECGQPPDDLGGEPIQPPLLSPGALSPNEQCSVM